MQWLVDIVYANEFLERYAKIAQSKWFKKAYENQSIGEIIEVEDND